MQPQSQWDKHSHLDRKSSLTYPPLCDKNKTSLCVTLQVHCTGKRYVRDGQLLEIYNEFCDLEIDWLQEYHTAKNLKS